MSQYRHSLIKQLRYQCLVLFILMVTAIVFFCTTTLGLFLITRVISLFFPIHFIHPGGRLIDTCQFEKIVIQHPIIDIEASHVEMSWHPLKLLQGKLPIRKISMNLLNIKKSHFSKNAIHPYLPFDLSIQHGTVNQLMIDINSVHRIFNEVHLGGSFSKKHVTLKQLSFKAFDTKWYTLGEFDFSWPLPINLSAKALALTPQGFTGTLNLHHDEQSGDWKMVLKNPYPVEVNGTIFKRQFQQNISLQPLTLNVPNQPALSLGKSTLTISGNWPNLSIHGLGSIIKPKELSWNIDGNGTTQKFIATTNYHIKEGNIQSTLGYDVKNFQPWSLDIKSTPLTLFKSGSLFKTGEVSGKITGTSWYTWDAKGRIILTPSEKINSLSFDVNAKHRLQDKKPYLEGILSLVNKELSFPAYDIHLSNISTSLTYKQNDWDIIAKSNLNGKPFSMSGHGHNKEGKGTLVGQDIPLVNNASYHVMVSPALEWMLSPEGLVLKGVMTIPHALIAPRQISDTVELTEDAVMVERKPKDILPEKNIPLTADILVRLGNDVRMDIKGLKTFLIGELSFRQTPSTPLDVIGTVHMNKGHYQAYGQHLAIRSGQLTFNHGFFENPEIQLRATKKLNARQKLEDSGKLFDFSARNLSDINYATNTTVGINVTGHMNKPEIHLFAIPAQLSQADILSLLLLGEPASQASQSGGRLLLAAIDSLNINDGSQKNQLIHQLKSLGFNFNVTNNPPGTPGYSSQSKDDNTSFVVGKALSKRLYLSYNVGLNQPDNTTLTLQYLLNQFFSIQLSRSQSENGQSGNGIDILYRHDK